jgi:anti-anti-sigma factor
MGKRGAEHPGGQPLAETNDLKKIDSPDAVKSVVTQLKDLLVETLLLKRVLLVTLSGSLDIRNADRLKDTLKDLVDSSPTGTVNVVIDVSTLQRITKAGLHALVTLRKQCKKLDGDVRISCEQRNRTVYEAFELTGLDKVFNIYLSDVEAVGSY